LIFEPHARGVLLAATRERLRHHHAGRADDVHVHAFEREAVSGFQLEVSMLAADGFVLRNPAVAMRSVQRLAVIRKASIGIS
jgi:hypothetical protein